MKKNLKQFVSITFFTALLVVVLNKISYIVQTKGYYATYGPFFEEAN